MEEVTIFAGHFDQRRLSMPVTLDWYHVILRIAFTVFAGLVIGFNRGEHGRPAGMRTTILVCLAASLSMIQANLLLNTAGRRPDSFITLDLMRLPLGILSGMGFIGAGAILRRGNVALGITTAATLWFTTMMGLLFGAGEIRLGLIALGIAFLTLWGLKYVEGIIRQEKRANLIVAISKGGPSDDDLRKLIADFRCRIISWGVVFSPLYREIRIEAEWRAVPHDTRVPGFVAQLAENSHIEKIEWMPQGALDGPVDNSGPFGTPIPISPAQ
jgi:putative Mg2+ transporter-C (MgtC) family protein